MITEDYVSFEIAKLLKEKGFDEYCFCINYPLPQGGHRNIIMPNLLNNSVIPFTNEYKFCGYKEDFITIPTIQIVMKWLREVHNIHIVIKNIIRTYGDTEYYYELYGTKNRYLCVVCDIYKEESWDSSEEAAEAAIKYCLEHLI